MFRRKPKEAIQPEWLIVGLGNPGAEYARTRHNVGFEVVEELSRRHRIKLDRGRNRALVGIGRIRGVAVGLVKPLTFMNLSGQSVAPLARQLGVPIDRIAVVADDLDLPVGQVRYRPRGGSGGHNGHKSLIQMLGTQEYPRLRIGIGRPGDATIEHVLSRFEPEERAEIDKAIAACADAVEELLADGLEGRRDLT
ncbi:MAG: aminoacyl-tRNA hydrolase [Chthonomonadaceae bacterium]|nr:aminoacyl-tRNA hydrolase [Chthonomonadaceae bacterium]